MSLQNNHHHKKFYAPHHFIFYPLLLVLIFCAAYKTIKSEGEMQWIWGFISIALLVITWLSYMTRQHYALTLQDRVVRLEMRVRYLTLTGQNLEPVESQLSFSQIAALRFAGDEELPALLQKTLKEHLTSKQIKTAIQNWKADENRV